MMIGGHTLSVNFTERAAGYDVVISNDILGRSGEWTRHCLGENVKKIVVVSNPTIFEHYGRLVLESLAGAGLDVSKFLIKDGETAKSFRSVEQTLNAFAEASLARTDAVVALGGGVVGDLAGFASAIYLRGIPFLQIPTTLLAMMDSSVGGKTGVNSAFGKNLIGAFHQPCGVLIDVATLGTLPKRELTAGFCEAIKHGALKGSRLLEKTNDYLGRYEVDHFAEYFNDPRFLSQTMNLVASNISFKAFIVAGDERESSSRLDGKSRKILNFGHTLAHALEKVTHYKYFKHGEAVGYGILFAAELSKSLALIDKKDVNLLYDVVHRAGNLPPLAGIDPQEVFEAFRFDKKHLSGSLQMILLKGIGRPVIRTEKDISHAAVKTVLKKLLRKWA